MTEEDAAVSCGLGAGAMARSGPLVGIRVVELAGLGPAPFCAMMLADYGAEVVRVDRLVSGDAAGERPPVDPAGDPPLYGSENIAATELLNRGRRSVAVDLKHEDGLATVRRLIDQADVLIEGFRPGVTERLGLGPDVCLERNPRLVYGRITGWGQEGPLASSSGHDINYAALSGSLHGIGRPGGPPVPPLHFLADFGGGGMLLTAGVLAALVEAGRSGRGQVVDAAMVDGSALLATMLHGFTARGAWKDGRVPENPPPGLGSHFYEVFETSDHEYISIGALEPQFYAELLHRLGLEGDGRFERQLDRSRWPELQAEMAAIFASRTRAAWCELLEGTEVCFAPVLSFAEAPVHPHNRARSTFVEVGGVVQPAPAPRFSRTPGAIQSPPEAPGSSTSAVLSDWGFSDEAIAELQRSGAVGGAAASLT